MTIGLYNEPAGTYTDDLWVRRLVLAATSPNDPRQ